MPTADEIRTSFDGYTIQGGQLISDRVHRIVAAIHERYPELEVRWIPDRQAVAENQNQFRIIYKDPEGGEHFIHGVKNEEEFDERVLKWLIQNDGRHNNVTLQDYEAWEEAKNLVEKQVWLDQLDEMEALTASIIKSNKDTYKVNKDLVIKENVLGNQAIKPKIIDAKAVKPPNARDLPDPFKHRNR